MSEETLHRIDSIRQKINAIHNNLLEERLNNENLQEKILFERRKLSQTKSLKKSLILVLAF